jgi:FAD/FMN-containing dehydrogenase
MSAHLTGRVLRPQDPSWDIARHGFAARVDYNGQEPQIIVFAQSAEDVANAVKWARANNVPVRARSGRHSYEGYSSLVKGGVIIDVSDMTAVSASDESGIAVVGAGIDMLELTQKLADVGVTIPMATGPTVGLGGLCQGGGFGVTSRLFGLTCDCVVDIQLVDAEGRIIHANEKENPNLFWALRGGGGGNFGIVTQFSFKTFKVDYVGVFNINYQWSDFEEIVAIWQDWSPKADWGLTSLISLHCDQTIVIQGQYTADPQDMPKLNTLLAPLFAGPAPIAVQIMVVPALQGANITFGVDPNNPSWAIRAHDDTQLFKSTSAVAYKALPPVAVTMLKTALENVPPLSATPSQPSMVQLLGGGGKAAEPATDATAVFYRKADFVVQYDGYWTAPQDAQPTIDWVVNLRKSMLPYASGAYVNYQDSMLGADWLEQYYGGNLDRLRQVKKEYDPGNFFNFPLSIPPAP